MGIFPKESSRSFDYAPRGATLRISAEGSRSAGASLTPSNRLKTDPSTPRQGGATLRISPAGSRRASQARLAHARKAAQDRSFDSAPGRRYAQDFGRRLPLGWRLAHAF